MRKSKMWQGILASAMAAVCAMGLLLSPLANAKDAPTELKFCGGAEGGFYSKLADTIGRSIVRGSNIKLDVVTTGGSVDAAELLKNGDCDIGLLQADAVATLPLPTDVSVTDAHLEAVYWLYGASGVDDFGKLDDSDLSKRFYVAEVRGSGAQVTMQNFAKTDTAYAKVRIVEFDDWMGVAKAVSQGYTMRNGERLEIAGAIYVSRPGQISSDITEDFSKAIKVGEVKDRDFAKAKDVNGNQLYVECTIASNQTNGLEVSTTFGGPETYCLRAQVVYNNDYHSGLDAKTSKELRRRIDKGINSEVKTVR